MYEQYMKYISIVFSTVEMNKQQKVYDSFFFLFQI